MSPPVPRPVPYPPDVAFGADPLDPYRHGRRPRPEPEPEPTEPPPNTRSKRRTPKDTP